MPRGRTAGLFEENHPSFTPWGPPSLKSLKYMTNRARPAKEIKFSSLTSTTKGGVPYKSTVDKVSALEDPF